MICPSCGKNNGDDEITCACGHSYQPVDSSAKTEVISADEVAQKINNDIGGVTNSDKAAHDTVVNDILTMKSAIIGKCELGEVLGKGGMGVVYKARHTTLDIPVAVKIMLPSFSDGNTFDKRFYREAQVAAKINHQNVVRVYDCGTEDGKLYIVMEYVDGGDLSEILDQGIQLSVKQGMDVALAIGAALVEAEKFDVIHRDIKPENIMVTRDGVYKLADLGLAKQIEKVPKEELGITVENICMGSPLYMSPEQGVDAKNCDIRADIYSLGCTLFTLLTGQPPYRGDNWQEIVCAHATSPVPSAKAINEAIPHELDLIIAKCMSKNRSDRFGSAQELYSELLSVTASDEIVVDTKSYTRVGTVGDGSSVMSSETSYRTETKIRSTVNEISQIADLTCSSCGKECVTRSSLKYTCLHEGCDKLICMDCWMRKGIRTCSEHIAKL